MSIEQKGLTYMKRLIAFIFILTVLISFGGLVAAAQTETDTLFNRKDERAEDKADIKSKLEEMQGKFDALTDADKQKIYDLADQMIALKQKMLTEYASLGIISEEKASMLSKMLKDHTDEMKKDGRIILNLLPPQSCRSDKQGKKTSLAS